MTARPRQWLTLALAPLVATAVLFAPATPAGAAPRPAPPPTADEGDEDKLLGDLLDDTGYRFVQAKNTYDDAVKKQLEASIKVRAAEEARDKLLPAAGRVASQSYRTGNLSAMGFLLDSDSSESFMKRAISLDEMNEMNDKTLHELNVQVAAVAAAKAERDRQIQAAQDSLQRMQDQRNAAEKAFTLIGGPTVTKGFVTAKSPTADPAARSANGTFSRESCSVDDPTTNGCITPRTLHMYKEVRKAGFKRFVGCHRNGGPFEHPKGRACDWSLQRSGFAPWHNDDTFKYGNDLMAFLVRNADRLGILYVIWNRMIWFPTRGWSRYHGPSAHIDHVHVSML